MKTPFQSFLVIALIINFSSLNGQSPLIIDHNCTDLSEIPSNWIDSAQNKLYIAYGHTSHGSQLASGMNALESYYTDGKFNWSHGGGSDELHLFEGDGSYMAQDVGYSGWDDKTREYLDDFPACNVIIWSWCGQVNSVDLPSHYLTPMSQLESEYPDVKFVYMTGHLEGLGPEGSLYTANQQIRDYCTTNNKTLFDFSDIEKYDPDQLINYQQYNANDECNYNHPEGGTRNWATDWISANPESELAEIAELCTSCAHSEGLNCVQKGIAAWWLWAKLAGWEATVPINIQNHVTAKIQLHLDPTSDILHLIDCTADSKLIVFDMQGRIRLKQQLVEDNPQINLGMLADGAYIVKLINNYGNSSQSLVVKF